MEIPDILVSWGHRLFVILPFACIIILEKYLRHRRFVKLTGCQPAYSKAPVKDPLIGLDFIYDKLFRGLPEKGLKDSCQTFDKLGSTYTVSRWTAQVIYTCDAGNVRHMLATGFEDFGLPKIRKSALTSLLGTGIFSLDGVPWSHARAVLRPTLTKKKMHDLPAMLEHHAQALLHRIPMDGTVFDLQPLFFGFTMDVSTDVFMGRSTGMLGSDKQPKRENQFIDDYLLCSEEVIKKMNLGPLGHFRWNTAADHAKENVFKYVDDYIDESLKLHLENPQTGCNFMQEMAAAVGDRKALRDQVLHFLLASRDTTATLLSNLFFVLAKKPLVYSKLREEILHAVGEETPAFDRLKDIKYLKWCVNESLRMHPVIPTNAREASRDTTLPHGGGKDGRAPLFVPKGTVVLYDMYTMHRDSGVYGLDTEEFVPERWDCLRPGWSFLPFSGGPRICIGQQFALLEAYYVIARLVQRFDTLESCDGREWMELPALVTTCKNRVHVKLHRSDTRE